MFSHLVEGKKEINREGRQKIVEPEKQSIVSMSIKAIYRRKY
jgi:hypothetical protein